MAQAKEHKKITSTLCASIICYVAMLGYIVLSSMQDRDTIEVIQRNMTEDTIAFHALQSGAEAEHTMPWATPERGFTKTNIKAQFMDYLGSHHLVMRQLKERPDTTKDTGDKALLQFTVQGTFINMLAMWGELQKDFPRQKIIIKNMQRIEGDTGQGTTAFTQKQEISLEGILYSVD